MSEITEPILLDSSFKSAMEKQNALMEKQNALLEVLARDKIKTLSSDWAGIHELVRDGFAKDIYDYGDLLTEPWTDVATGQEYTADWHVAHFADVELKDSETVPGMFIQWHWATPYSVQFSHQRAFLACPDGLTAGTYTIKFAQSWSKFTQLSWYFTLTKDVPAGGRLAGFYNGADNASGYKVYSYSADGKTVNETVTPTAGESGTVLGTLAYSTRSGNLNSMQETFYGWNRWSTSAIRQWLNSAAGIGEWWTAQDAWDIAPDQLTSKAGFLSGCSAELVNAMQTVKVTTYPNTVQDDTAGNTPDITYDKVFLPSLQQMYINPQKAGEGEYWEYWKRASGRTSVMAQYSTYPEIKHYAVESHTSAQSVRLRGAYRGGACSPWIVASGGYVDHYSACLASRCAPACVI